MKMLARIALALVLIAITALPGMAQGSPITEHEEGYFPFTGYFYCNEEPPIPEVSEVLAYYRSVTHTNPDGAGGFHLNYSEQVRFEGEGSQTGYYYKGNWTYHYSEVLRVNEVYTELWHARVKNMDTNRTSMLKVMFQLTVDESGNVTVERDISELRCLPPL